MKHWCNLEYPSCLQAALPSLLFQSSEQTVLHFPWIWTCRTELLPLRRTERQTHATQTGNYKKGDGTLSCFLKHRTAVLASSVNANWAHLSSGAKQSQAWLYGSPPEIPQILCVCPAGWHCCELTTRRNSHSNMKTACLHPQHILFSSHACGAVDVTKVVATSFQTVKKSQQKHKYFCTVCTKCVC